ncbi:CHAT domain-containing protein [Nonomuraea sp. NPDC059007]|uniref:CHAT domain-containing protein n=1 Tax=Nonomuraea sp. NPDC059007 TaxID=3346692 RepID=UPI003684C51C
MFGKRSDGSRDAAKRLRAILRDSRRSKKAKAQALLELASELFPLGDHQVRAEALDCAIRLYMESGDPRAKDEIIGRLGSEMAAMADAGLRYGTEGTQTLGDSLYAYARSLSDPSLARTLLEKALAVHEAYGDIKGQADALERLATLDVAERRDTTHAERALAYYTEIGDGQGRVKALHLVSSAAKTRGDPGRSQAYLEEALRIARACGDVDAEAVTLLGLATRVMVDRRDTVLSRQYVVAASELLPRLNDQDIASGIYSMLASSDMAHGDFASAERNNRRALEYESTPWAGMAAHVHGAATEYLITQDRAEEVTQEALNQVRLLEAERRSLGTAHNQARWYQEHRPAYLRAMRLAAASGDGHAALEVVESARAQALAATLSVDPAVLAEADFTSDGEVDRLLRRISTFEDAGPDAFGGAGNLSAEDATGWNKLMAHALEEDHARLADIIGTQLLRQAGPVESVRDHRAKLSRGTHALVYDIEWNGDVATVYTVWVPPLPGEPTVERIALDAEQSHYIRTFADQNAAVELLNQPAHAWQARLTQLIPEGLQKVLTAPNQPQNGADLVIVPAGEMWAVPFSAIRVGPAPLIEVATPALAPSLAVAATASTRKVRRVRRAVALLDTGLRGTSWERDALTQHFRLTEVQPLTRYLVDALNAPNTYELGVVSAHGDHVRGLAHALHIGERGRLFAGVLLRCRVPLWWVMGACWSGHLDPVPGHEPVGLPTVALLRGARAVIGALHRVPDRATGRILATTYGGMANGAPAPAALRTAQREYLVAARGNRPLIHWAPLVAIGAPGTSS